MEEIIIYYILKDLKSSNFDNDPDTISVLCLTKQQKNFYLNNLQGNYLLNHLYKILGDQKIDIVTLTNLLKENKLKFTFNNIDDQTLFLVVQPKNKYHQKKELTL